MIFGRTTGSNLSNLASFGIIGISLDKALEIRVRTVNADSAKGCAGIHFASRFRSWVKRVAGASIFEVLELPDQKYVTSTLRKAQGHLTILEAWLAELKLRVGTTFAKSPT